MPCPRLVSGLAPRGQMIVVGAGNDPVALSPIDLLFGERGVEGTMTGSVAGTEDALAFSVASEHSPDDRALSSGKSRAGISAHESNEARFRVVLVMKP